jgi:hypothetical protein
MPTEEQTRLQIGHVLFIDVVGYAWTTHDGGVTELRVNPFLLAYKDNGRFIAFAQKVGVMPKAAANP